MIDFLIFAVVGIVTGTMAGLFGVGGGLIIVPVMHYILTSDGLAENVAIPLSIGTALACIIVHLLLQHMPIGIKIYLSKDRFLQLSAGILIGAGFGCFFVINVDAGLLKNILAIFVSFMALGFLLILKCQEQAKNLTLFTLMFLEVSLATYLQFLVSVGAYL